jgi:hypothetical protein
MDATKNDTMTETAVESNVATMEEIESGPNRGYFEELKPAIMAIRDRDVEEPAYPVRVFTQAGNAIGVQADIDRQVLLGYGLSGELIDSIPKRVGALHYADARMQATVHLQSPYRVVFDDLQPEAIDVRAYLMHGLRYVLADERGSLRLVRKVSEGASQDDLIHDLELCGQFCREHKAKLTAIGFDTGKVTRAEQLCQQLGVAKAQMEGVRHDVSATNVRDRAYTYLKQGLDKVRACGRYAFWKDEVKAAKYTIDYPSCSRRQKVEEEEVAVEATQS